ncbi:hypothetical protein ACN4EK_27325 [Pantanalinema rosaneae CENA516]|uniref:hypothetical protein n=1 Tax=Pantanalinema rosaneae TaxID=1620701 RepID=UPI003D6EE2C7
MGESSNYWKLVRLDAASDSRGYKVQPLAIARGYFQTHFPGFVECLTVADQSVQAQLWSYINVLPHPGGTEAELCLRCYVSHAILKACAKRARLFSSGNRFTYRDLLPFVLDDDGCLPLGHYVPFAVELVRSFRPEHHCSLAGWTDFRVRRHPELNHFLLECGLQFITDWALLNKSNPRHLEPPERDILEVFHAIYRRDRLRYHRSHRQPCSQPTPEQLTTMLRSLRERQVVLATSQDLLSYLRQIASHLRQAQLWGRRGTPLAESLEVTNPYTGETQLREVADLSTPMTPEEAERLDLQAFCHQQLLACLDAAIQRSICDRLTTLKRSKRRSHLAEKLQPALRLLYFEHKSQTEIATLLNMTDQYEVSRLLDLKSLLGNIRHWTREQLLTCLLDKARQLQLVQDPLPPSYLSNLIQHVDGVIDETIFRAAAAETRASKNRTFNSLYAQRFCLMLDALHSVPSK